MGNTSGDTNISSKRAGERMACLSYAFFFAVPLLIGIKSNLIFSIFFLIATFFLMFGIFAPMKLQGINRFLNIPLSMIHFLISQLFLFIFYFFILTPAAFIFRFCGRNLISLDIEKERLSYWRPAEESRKWIQFFKDPF